jgi:hypothetical protein
MKKIISIILFLSVLNIAYSQKNKTTFDLLQGKWQSQEDKKSFVIFEGNVQKSVYENTISSEIYWLSDSCESEYETSKNNKNGNFIVQRDEMCWGIEVDEDRLSMTYIGKGNTLSYKRVKAINTTLKSVTKKYCDGLNAWYYLVTINQSKITMKCFADKKNNYHKNKTIPTRIYVGNIIDGEIKIKGKNEGALFKLKNNVLYDYNVEGGGEDGNANEYTLCK